ncbi:MAG: octopine/nopaline dehydrogenase [Firmicutes bacterium]|nr:octopine/nopaline dehydrogenase [Bacillota bacterium]
MEKTKFAIIGAGNGGQSFAGHLTLLGYSVSLFDVEKQKVDDLKKTGCINVTGAVEGNAKISLITGDIGAAVKGADVIMVIIPTVYQRSIAISMAPFLVDGQIIVLNPGATGGALEVRTAIREAGSKANITIAETNTLLYACRSPRAGEAVIGGIKETVEVAALPATAVSKVVALLNQPFPQYKAVESVLVTSLNNVNAMMHPAPTILNAGRVECKAPFYYYSEGITPALSKIIEKLDAERLAIGAALGVKLLTIEQWYKESYGVTGANLYDLVQNVKAYEGIKGPTTLNTRYIFEDIPTGLVPLSLLGRALGVPTSTMNAVVELGNILLGKNFWEEGRSLEKLGLAGKSPAEIRELVIN